jgi:hypothetical protein
MAGFVKCLECKRPYSDAAGRCPTCGTPIGKRADDVARPRSGSALLPLGLMICAGAAGAYLYGRLPSLAGAPAPAPPAPQSVPTAVQTKFGLTEEKRREAYGDLVAAEDHAELETDRRYPPLDPGASSNRWQMHAEMRERFRKQVDDEDKKAIGKRYGLTNEQLGAIHTEGIQNEWPRPARRSIR